MLPRSRFPLLDNPGRLRNCSRKLHARCRILDQPGEGCFWDYRGATCFTSSQGSGNMRQGAVPGCSAHSRPVSSARGGRPHARAASASHPSHTDSTSVDEWGQLASQDGCGQLQNTSSYLCIRSETRALLPRAARLRHHNARHPLSADLGGQAWPLKRWASQQVAQRRSSWGNLVGCLHPTRSPPPSPNCPQILATDRTSRKHDASAIGCFSDRPPPAVGASQLSLQRVSCRCTDDTGATASPSSECPTDGAWHTES